MQIKQVVATTPEQILAAKGKAEAVARKFAGKAYTITPDVHPLYKETPGTEYDIRFDMTKKKKFGGVLGLFKEKLQERLTSIVCSEAENTKNERTARIQDYTEKDMENAVKHGKQWLRIYTLRGFRERYGSFKDRKRAKAIDLKG